VCLWWTALIWNFYLLWTFKEIKRATWCSSVQCNVFNAPNPSRMYVNTRNKAASDARCRANQQRMKFKNVYIGLCHGLGVSLRALQHECPGSIPDQSIGICVGQRGPGTCFSLRYWVVLYKKTFPTIRPYPFTHLPPTECSLSNWQNRYETRYFFCFCPSIRAKYHLINSGKNI